MPPKIPQSPPVLDAETASRGGFLQDAYFYAYQNGPLVDGAYLHWDQLRRRPPLKGLSREQWWHALTVARRGASRPVTGFYDTSETPFRYSFVAPIEEKLHGIAQRMGGGLETSDSGVNEGNRDRYLMSSLMQEAITSSQLEGATTTRLVAKEMLRSERQPKDASERMILNNFLTMRHIREIRDQALTPELVLELHRLVTKDTLGDGASGRLRRADENVAVMDDYNTVYHQPPPASQLAERMKRMCVFANAEDGAFVNPVLRAIILHFWLAYDHPFVDGNGRTARALFYWCMLHEGYWLFEFVSISQTILKAPIKYARAFLYTETDSADLTYFVLYHLELLEQAVADLDSYIKRKRQELSASTEQLQGLQALNHRQKVLVQHALQHAGQPYTIQAHRMDHGVTYQTARTDLMGLEKAGLMCKTKLGKRFVYRAPADLAQRLKA